MDATTSGGHITLNQVYGTLTFATSGGNLKLNSVAGTINGKTSGGNISGEIKSIINQCNLKTSGGNISVMLPSKEGYELEAFRSAVKANLTDFKGNKKRDEITGTVRNGGGRVYLKTSDGLVTINE